jgi:Fe-S-cluster containining protein
MKIEHKELCSACGGKCCKTLPGNYYPSDFNLPEKNPTEKDFKKLIEIIKKDKIAVDWWEDENSKYFLRPAIKKANRKFDPTWGGECIHLTEKGCELSFYKRPLECKQLEPKGEFGKCYIHGNLNKETAYKAWLEYNNCITNIHYGENYD